MAPAISTPIALDNDVKQRPDHARICQPSPVLSHALQQTVPPICCSTYESVVEELNEWRERSDPVHFLRSRMIAGSMSSTGSMLQQLFAVSQLKQVARLFNASAERNTSVPHFNKKPVTTVS